MKNQTTSDFKARIVRIMRKRNGYGDYAVVGAPHSDPCLVRKPTDRGYYPPNYVRCADHVNGGATFCPRGGAALQQWQAAMWRQIEGD